MRERRYVVEENLGNYNIRYYGAYSTFEEAQRRREQIIYSSDNQCEINIIVTTPEVRVEIKQKSFELELGNINLF